MRKCNKVCWICGDKASGFHFDAMSCESCKSFFRRNALKTICYLGGNCKIDVLNRTFCKRCRLEKCFEVGMKTKYIYSEEQKAMRKALIEENKVRKMQNLGQSQGLAVVSNGEYDWSASDSSSTTMTSPVVDTCEDNREDPLEFLEKEVFSEEEVNAEIVRIENYISGNNMTNVCETVFEKVAELELTVLPIPRPSVGHTLTTFDESEGFKLTELFEAIKLIRHPVDRIDCQEIPNNYWGAVHVLHSTCDNDIKHIIKMCKSLNAFRGLEECDQIVLLKYASIEIVVLQMVLSFDFEHKFWDIITDSHYSHIIRLELLKSSNTYVNHKNFLQNMGQEWDSDPVIIDLLTAILLFNANRPKLANKDLVK
ncbi:unnamed protein product [Medioppia subpectinata]|uniref:Nuclear receptor domain-containing protein n=1 Tax=Medioppia subpectinata TaxID=1979941 RepID=A0A7R9KD45_9ACAR|nr:unnamed protein product [Medioppia subpectinata]CAG2100062.1 unnamed protein product [Medioppia subpectinata]